MTLLLGITGKAGSGKDTVADYLKANYNFRSVAFAGPLKNGVKAMFNLTDKDLDHPLKEQVIPYIGKSPRQLMQLLGTEYGRNLVHEDLWLLLAANQIKKHRDDGYNVVLTDCRFDNEADFVRYSEGKVIHVHRPSAGTSFAHSSEVGVKPCLEDYSLINDSTFGELYRQVDSLMEVLY